MSKISMVEAELPPGFRFHPRDEELICDYLMKKVTCCDSTLMIEVDLNKCEPWDIPETACVGGEEWYFYSKRDRKYAIGLRTNRATTCGYWKATGKDRAVLHKGTLVGMRKTLVFYQGRAPKGRKTDWVMHEFRLEGPFSTPIVSSLKEDWVLCRVLYKKREVLPGKAINMESCYYDDMTCSSSLPPLMDTYTPLDQITQPNPQDDDYEQVHCFSNFSQDQTFLSSHMNMMEPNLPNMPTFGGTSPDLVTYLNPSLDCDKDVLKDFLNHLTKLETSTTNMEANSPSICETSSDSYLYI